MSDVLEEWAYCSIEYVLNIEIKPSFEECILLLAKNTFNIENNDNFTLNEFQDIIIQYFGEFSDENNDLDHMTELHRYLKYCLVMAVSPNCPDQSNHVQNILSMDASHQQFLMQAIQTGPQIVSTTSMDIDDEANDNDNNELNSSSTVETEKHFQDSMCADNDDSSEATEPMQDETPIETKKEMISSLPVLKSVLNYQPNLDAEMECQVCESKYQTIVNQQKMIEQLTAREQDSQTRFKAEISMGMSKLVDAEVLLLDKDQQIAQLTDTVDLFTRQVTELEEKLKGQNDNSTRVQVLQDRIEVLEPEAARAEAMEAQLVRLRDRLEEQGTVKQQLKEEAQAHAETHNKLLEAEAELEVTRKHKPLLEEYRSKHAESMIALESLTLRLKTKEEELQRMQDLQASISNSENNGLLQVHRLAEELHVAAERIRTLERVGGIGEGMTELNPVIMNELRSLRTQNQDLLTKLDDSSLDSLDRLRNQLAEQACVNTSLNGKWLATTDELKRALGRIENIQQTLAQAHEDHSNLSQRLVETEQMNLEEVDSMRYEYEVKIQNIKSKNADELAMLISEKDGIISELTRDLNHTKSVLQSTESEVVRLESEKAELEATVASLTEQIRLGRIEIKRIVDDYEQQLTEMEEAHSKAINEEEERTRAVIVEKEMEQAKRRRVERERKLLEAEVHRSKTQVQVGGGSSSQELEVALREFKSMQAQLEDARNEILQLRSSAQTGSQSSSLATISESDDLGTGDGDGSRRSKRMRGPTRNFKSTASTERPNSALDSDMFQQNEVSEKRLEQLQRERREMIARNLEENKEKMELSQKLLMCEREITMLKTKLTKLTLENERLDRKMAKSSTISDTQSNSNDMKENIAN